LFDARKFKTENGFSMRTEVESVDAEYSKETQLLHKEAEKDLLACTCSKKINYIEVK